MIVAVATLAGTPTAGSFLQATDQVHFNRLIVFAGLMIVIGAVAVGAAWVLGSKKPVDSVEAAQPRMRAINATEFS
jgi:hypothetical protein